MCLFTSPRAEEPLQPPYEEPFHEGPAIVPENIPEHNDSPF